MPLRSVARADSAYSYFTAKDFYDTPTQIRAARRKLSVIHLQGSNNGLNTTTPSKWILNTSLATMRRASTVAKPAPSISISQTKSESSSCPLDKEVYKPELKIITESESSIPRILDDMVDAVVKETKDSEDDVLSETDAEIEVQAFVGITEAVEIQICSDSSDVGQPSLADVVRENERTFEEVQPDTILEIESPTEEVTTDDVEPMSESEGAPDDYIPIIEVDLKDEAGPIIFVSGPQLESIEVDNAPDIEVDNAPDIEVDNAPDIEVDNAPDIEVDNTPDIEVDNAPDIEVDNTRDIEVDNTPDIKVDNTRDIEVDNALDIEVDNTPDIEVDNTRDIEVNHIPDIEVNRTPDIEIENTPETEVDNTPNIESTTAAEVSANNVPEIDPERGELEVDNSASSLNSPQEEEIEVGGTVSYFVSFSEEIQNEVNVPSFFQCYDQDQTDISFSDMDFQTVEDVSGTNSPSSNPIILKFQSEISESYIEEVESSTDHPNLVSALPAEKESTLDVLEEMPQPVKNKSSCVLHVDQLAATIETESRDQVETVSSRLVLSSPHVAIQIEVNTTDVEALPVQVTSEITLFDTIPPRLATPSETMESSPLFDASMADDPPRPVSATSNNSEYEIPLPEGIGSTMFNIEHNDLPASLNKASRSSFSHLDLVLLSTRKSEFKIPILLDEEDDELTDVSEKSSLALINSTHYINTTIYSDSVAALAARFASGNSNNACDSDEFEVPIQNEDSQAAVTTILDEILVVIPEA